MYWEQRKHSNEKDRRYSKRYSSVLGYEDTALEPWLSDHRFLALTLEHRRQRFVQHSWLKNQFLNSITPVVRIPESLGLMRCHGGLLQPPGHCSANKPSALILTSLFDHFLMRERVSETFSKKPWFPKTWLEWSVTDSFSHRGGMQIGQSVPLCPSNSSHNTRRLSPWKLIAYLPGGRRRKAGFGVSDVSGTCGVRSVR